ncbi:MAG: hypothetical protein U1F98_09035 [Verrucomicrobiota bacterium]
MKRRLDIRMVAAASLCGATIAGAQSPADDTIPYPLLLRTTAPERYWKASLSYSLGLNIKTTFQGIGGLTGFQNNPGSTNAGANHNYDNGYNRVDITGNNHGGFQGTWNWGYQNAGQVSGNSITMQSSSVTTSSTENNSPRNGFEIGLARELARHDFWRWGVEGAFGLTLVNVHDDRTVSGTLTQVNDTYSLNGVVPAVPPYNGTYNGPGAIIGDTPNRSVSTVPGVATVTGWRNFDANLFQFRVGPYVEFPLGKGFTFDLKAGLALVEVASRFSYNETVTGPSGTTTSAASSSSSGFLIGAYAGADASYNLTDSVSLFAGVQYQDVGQYTHTLNGRKAVLDLGESVFVNLGFSYSF